MKPEVIYRMIYEYDLKFCKKNCQAKKTGRCCPRESCENVLEGSPELKKLFDKSKAAPFLGKEGCLVPPEQRIFCTSFICDVFADSKFFKGHMKLISRLPMRERLDFNSRINGILTMMRNMKKRGYNVSDVMKYLKGGKE